MNMIEKVAIAMANKSQARVAGLSLLNKVEMSGEENFMLLAKAAIEAMREPTLVMRQAGAFRGRLIDLGNGKTADGMALGDHPISSYIKMIDAALSEETP